MAGPDAGTGVAMEVLVKRNQVVPQGIVLKEVDRTEHRPPSLSVIEEDPRETLRDLLRHLPQRHHLTGTRRALDAEALSEVVMELLERLDDEEVDREPDRPAPVRVAAEQAAVRLGRLVVDGVAHPHRVEDV